MKKPTSSREEDILFGAAARSMIDRLSRQLIDNLPGTRSGEDIEALHDMRVASRRLRSALRIFKPVFRKKRLFETAETGVKDVTQALGTVRDIDVFLEFLANFSRGTDSDLSWLIEHEGRQREEARTSMLRALDAMERSGLHYQISQLLSEESILEDPQVLFSSQAFWLVAPSISELVMLSGSLEDPKDIAGLHQMRIAAKRLRYTLEPFASVFGKPLVDRISQVKALQEYLGDIHDSDVWVDKLEHYGRVLDLTDRQAGDLKTIIDERLSHRKQVYSVLCKYWQGLNEQLFADNILRIVARIPDGDIHTQEVQNVVETDVLEGQGAEIAPQDADVSAVAKPARRRTRAKSATSIESAQKSAKPADETDVKVEDSTPPRHPGIVHLKELIADGGRRLSSAGNFNPKLAKQFSKLDSTLDDLHVNLRNVKLKTAARAEKWMYELKTHLTSLPEDGRLSEKKAETLRQNVRDLRKKLGEIKKR